MIRRRLPTWIALAGAVLLALVVVWWWLVFRQIVLNAYMTVPRALPCMVGQSIVCTLAQDLCTSDHILGIKRYYVAAFWVGFALVALGTVIRLTQKTRTSPSASHEESLVSHF